MDRRNSDGSFTSEELVLYQRQLTKLENRNVINALCQRLFIREYDFHELIFTYQFILSTILSFSAPSRNTVEKLLDSRIKYYHIITVKINKYILILNVKLFYEFYIVENLRFMKYVSRLTSRLEIERVSHM